MEVVKIETVVKRFDSSGKLLDITTTVQENLDIEDDHQPLTGLYL